MNQNNALCPTPPKLLGKVSVAATVARPTISKNSTYSSAISTISHIFPLFPKIPHIFPLCIFSPQIVPYLVQAAAVAELLGKVTSRPSEDPTCHPTIFKHSKYFPTVFTCFPTILVIANILTYLIPPAAELLGKVGVASLKPQAPSLLKSSRFRV